MSIDRTPDIAAGRLTPEEYAGQFRDLHPAARPARGLRRGRPLLFLLRRAVHAGLPDRHRHPDVHPRDPDRQPEGRGRDDLRPEHPRRHVRPRLPDRDAVRGGLRARAGGGQAGQDRRAAALRDRLLHGRSGEPALRARRRRPASASPSSAPGRRASACAHRLAMHGHEVVDLRRAGRRLGGLNEYGIAAYKTVERLRPGGGRLHPRRSAASRSRPARRSAATSRSPSSARTTTPSSSASASPASTRSALPRSDARGRRATRSTSSPSCARRAISPSLPVGRRVVVIGGGMTAIDVAVAVEAARRRGRDDRLPPRRGARWAPREYERELAQTDGVMISSTPCRSG